MGYLGVEEAGSALLLVPGRMRVWTGSAEKAFHTLHILESISAICAADQLRLFLVMPEIIRERKAGSVHA